MRPAEEIRRFIDKAAVSTNPQADRAVLEAVLIAHKKTMDSTSAPTRPSVRSIVMGNSYVKLALAAVVVLAVVLGLSEFLAPGGKSGVAWAQVLEKTEHVPVVIFDMTAEITESQGRKLVMPSKNYVAGDYGTRSDTYLDGNLMAIKYRLPNKKVAYQVRVDQKKYWRFDLRDEEAAKGRDADDPRTWLKMILSRAYTKLGRATINGVAAEGIESSPAEMVGQDGVVRLWVDVETNLPVRIEVEMREREGGRMKPQKFVMENFQWNAHLDESLFEPNIPADYTPGEDPRAGQTRQENAGAQPAAPQALTEQERAALPQIKETVTLFLQAGSNRNWDEMLKHASGLAKLSAADRTALDTHLGGLEILQVGEPFKADASSVWRVPCQIKWKAGAIGGKEIRVRYDETLGKFVVCGGL
jgi:outer membrane lipoprotein-sorting protein